MVGLPLMRDGALMIEVFAHPLLHGTCLSYFLSLGSVCGIRHRVYHPGQTHHGHTIEGPSVHLRGCHVCPPQGRYRRRCVKSLVPEPEVDADVATETNLGRERNSLRLKNLLSNVPSNANHPFTQVIIAIITEWQELSSSNLRATGPAAPSTTRTRSKGVGAGPGPGLRREDYSLASEATNGPPELLATMQRAMSKCDAHDEERQPPDCGTVLASSVT